MGACGGGVRHTMLAREWSSGVCSSDVDRAVDRHRGDPGIGLLDIDKGERAAAIGEPDARSEERRVGKEGGRRSWMGPGRTAAAKGQRGAGVLIGARPDGGR